MNVEDVFVQSGVPTVTFVAPQSYRDMKIAIRTPGRCVVVEGPSGIGKTSCVTKILSELSLLDRVRFLAARRPKHRSEIESLHTHDDIGIVVVDDFHVLGDTTKKNLADMMKLLADTGDEYNKIILIGINKAGERLVEFGADLALRIEIFKLGGEPYRKDIGTYSKGREGTKCYLHSAGPSISGKSR